MLKLTPNAHVLPAISSGSAEMELINFFFRTDIYYTLKFNGSENATGSLSHRKAHMVLELNSTERRKTHGIWDIGVSVREGEGGSRFHRR